MAEVRPGIAWAAGIFEGEGSIVVRPAGGKKPGLQRRLQVAMTDRDVLDRFRDVVGAGTVRGPFDRKPNYKPIYIWTCSRWSDIDVIVRAFYPHFLKRRQAMADLMLASAPRDKRKTHCKRGHPLRGDGANVRTTDGYPACRPCAMARYFAKRVLSPPRPPHRPVCRRGHLMEGPDAQTWSDKRGRRQCTRCVRIRRLELAAVRLGTALRLPNTRALKGLWIAEPAGRYLASTDRNGRNRVVAVPYQAQHGVPMAPGWGSRSLVGAPTTIAMDGKLGPAVADSASPARETAWT